VFRNLKHESHARKSASALHVCVRAPLPPRSTCKGRQASHASELFDEETRFDIINNLVASSLLPERASLRRLKECSFVTSALHFGSARPLSLTEYGQDRLEALCSALGLPEQERRDASLLFDQIGADWAEWPVSDTAPWENDLTDDGTPFEFSVGFEGDKPELRILFESQLRTGKPSQHTSWQAGIQLQRRLRDRGLCELAELERVLQLFVPGAGPEPRFALWHAVALQEQAPLFKAYLNPEVHGAERSRELTAEAFARLGQAAAWLKVEERLGPETRIPYLSLDLSPAKSARLKVYLSATDAHGVEQLVRGSSNTRPGVASAWLEQLTQSAGPYGARPILTCLGFRSSSARPEATVHVPVRNYAPNDEIALERTVELLPAASGRQLQLALLALAREPLHRSKGVLSYVSLRNVEDRVRVTTYLAPGACSEREDRRESGAMPTGRPAAG